MIIFAWKVNNPLSFLISPRLVKAFSVPFQFVLEFTLFTVPLNKCLRKHTRALMLFIYLINFHHTVFLSMWSRVLYVDDWMCYTLSVVLIQWRQHTSPRYMFTRLSQQTVSCPSQNNVLQADADGRRNKSYYSGDKN